MGMKHRSARGEIVDLDLIKIKQEIASAPKPINVNVREEFIDKKVRRRIKRKKTLPDLAVLAVEDPITDDISDVEEDLIDDTSVNDEPTITK